MTPPPTSLAARAQTGLPTLRPAEAPLPRADVDVPTPGRREARGGRTATAGSTWRRRWGISVALHAVVLGLAWWLIEDPEPERWTPGGAQVGLLAPDIRDDAAQEDPFQDPVVDPVATPLEAPVLPAEVIADPLEEPLTDLPALEATVPMDDPIVLRTGDVRRPRRMPVAPPVVSPPPVAAPAPVPVPSAPAVAPGPRRPLVFTRRPDPMTYYPEAARRAGITGQVWVGLEIDPRGRVVQAWVHRSSGHPLLDAAATRLMKEARFAPPGTTRRAAQPVNFSLRSVRR